jgi:hypothetical protein
VTRFSLTAGIMTSTGGQGSFFFNKNMTIVDLTAVEHIQWPETSMFLEFE